MAVTTRKSTNGPSPSPGREVVKLASKLAWRTVSKHVPTPTLPDHVREVPIQCSIDIAVPLELAYEEWMKLDFLPEGAHRVEDIERDGDSLTGRLTGTRRHVEWEAEIRDERPCEAFAWRSTVGSDCAGLLTFHRLSDRLTRLELELDVVPVHMEEAIELLLRIADRRAEGDIRRFKARLETISPDDYPSLEETGGNDDDKDEEDE